MQMHVQMQMLIGADADSADASDPHGLLMQMLIVQMQMLIVQTPADDDGLHEVDSVLMRTFVESYNLDIPMLSPSGYPFRAAAEAAATTVGTEEAATAAAAEAAMSPHADDDDDDATEEGGGQDTRALRRSASWPRWYPTGRGWRELELPSWYDMAKL